MSNLIQKITIRHKLNNLYHKVKYEYRDTVERFDKHKVSITSATMSLVGLVGYTNDMYTHIHVSNGILDSNVYNDKKFSKLINTIKEKADNLNAELMKYQIECGSKANWKDNNENDACLNHLTETFGNKK